MIIEFSFFKKYIYCTKNITQDFIKIINKYIYNNLGNKHKLLFFYTKRRNKTILQKNPFRNENKKLTIREKNIAFKY